MNNDVEAIEPGWLDQMAGWLFRPGVGVVSAKLLYADDSIQHVGVLVSSWHGTPEHLFRRLAGDDAGYQRWPHRARNVSAVTGACLLTRTALYRDLGGFDAEHLAVQFNDIDYCLKAIAAGFAWWSSLPRSCGTTRARHAGGASIIARMRGSPRRIAIIATVSRARTSITIRCAARRRS